MQTFYIVTKRLFCCFLFAFFLLSCKEKFTSFNHLRMGNGAEPESLDPHLCSGVPCGRILNGLFTGLTQWSPTGPKPGVAKAWEFSDDGTVYTFHLRPSQWSDRTPITAKDFVYSWQRLANPATGSKYSNLIESIQGFSKIQNNELPPDSLAVEALNDSTLQVTLTNPVPYFLELTSFVPLFPVPKHKISQFANSWTQPENASHNGPFLLKEWSTYKLIQLVANPHWVGGKAKLDTLSFFPIDDNKTELSQFRADQLDWIHQVPSSSLSAWKDKPEYNSGSKFGTYLFRFNTTLPEFKDPKVRLALNFATDRETITKFVTKGFEPAAEGLVPDGIHDYQTQRTLRFNPEKAKKLWSEAKNKPEKLTLVYNQSEGNKKIAEAVAQMWQQNLGVPVEVQNVEWKTLLSKMNKLDYQIIRGSWIGDYMDPSTFLDLFRTENPNNRTGYSNLRYDSLALEAVKETNRDQRMQLLSAMEMELLQDPPILPLYFYQNKELRKPSLKGIQENPLGLYPLASLYFEEKNPD